MELTPYPAKQQGQMLTYKQIFSANAPMGEKVAVAAARLALMLSQPLEDSMLDGWVQQLSTYDDESLTFAFNQAERMLDAWPTVSKVIRILGDRQFEQDLQYLLDGIRSNSWEDNYHGGSDFKRWPEPPGSLQRVLCRFSRGSAWKKGLRRLGGHPALNGWPSVDGSEESERTASRLEKEFRVAWDRAQMEVM